MAMEIQQFKYIYEDLKQQLKEIPSIEQLLTLTEKSTKKLECKNLYSLADKRDFALEMQDEQIMKDIIQTYRDVQDFGKQPTQEAYGQTNEKIFKIKQKYMQTFDMLNKQEELLTQEIQLAQYSIDEQHHDDQIKEVDEYDEEPKELAQDRIQKLKKEIEEISSKLAKINNGRGKWFKSDHTDFIKIYNRCGGNDKKILSEGVKVLGMKNTEIMDHLEVYETFLQLEKEKKIISEEYRQIKAFEKMEMTEQKYNKDMQKKQKQKIIMERQIQENIKKKEMVQKFKQTQLTKKNQMLKEQSKKDDEKKNAALAAKKKVEQRAKKLQQAQNKVISKSKSKYK